MLRLPTLCYPLLFILFGGFSLNQLLAPGWVRAGGDHLTLAQIAQRQADFVATPLLPGENNYREGVLNTLVLMKFAASRLSSKERRALIEASWHHQFFATAGLKIWDDSSADGDIVRISSMGFHVNVLLSSTPQDVFLPVTPGVPITITALSDGAGGGITAAVVGIHFPADDDAYRDRYLRRDMRNALGKPLVLPLLRPGENVSILLKY